MSGGLTIKQEKFTREYVKTGNGTQAARKAGYRGDDNVLAVTASRDLLKNPKVSAEIQALRNRLVEKLDISREKVINNIAHIAEQAHAIGDYAPAIKANELILKAQGYLVEKSLNMNVDVTQQHLDALQRYTDQRINEALQNHKADKAVDVTGDVGEAHEHVSAHSLTDAVDVQDRSMDVMEHTHVDDATDEDVR